MHAEGGQGHADRHLLPQPREDQVRQPERGGGHEHDHHAQEARGDIGKTSTRLRNWRETASMVAEPMPISLYMLPALAMES